MDMGRTVAVPPTAYPPAPETLLKQSFVGKDLRDIDGPAAVLDIALIRRNCQLMHDAVDALKLDFRAHVKTHKTTQVTRLQVGDERQTDARIIVSTIQEAETQYVLLQEYQKRGRKVNLLYGIPPSQTAYARLKRVRDALGNDNVSFLVDHPAQLQSLIDPLQKTNEPVHVPVFANVDVGYHREGVASESRTLEILLQAIKQAPNVKLLGFYSHNSLSYAAGSMQECMQYLKDELEEIHRAAKRATSLGLAEGGLTLSVGSSPPVLSVQNHAVDDPMSSAVNALLTQIKANYNVELHAGVYPILDCQQMAARSRPAVSAAAAAPTMTEDDIALRVLVDVLSVYTEREKPEALIGAGTLALGREPCKSYPGWAVVAPSPWAPRSGQQKWTTDEQVGWIVGRVSQEHGILVWQGPADQMRALVVGEKLLLWPNHACITSAGFGWYVVVDSDRGEEKATEIVDIWIRARGW